MEQSNLKLDLSIQEADLVLKAISQLPYYQVHGLIAKIQEQTYPQLQAMKVASTHRDGAPVDEPTE